MTSFEKSILIAVFIALFAVIGLFLATQGLTTLGTMFLACAVIVFLIWTLKLLETL